MPGERGAQRLLETQGDSKCKQMNPNDHQDKKKRLGRKQEARDISGNSLRMAIWWSKEAKLHPINVCIGFISTIHAEFKHFFK